MVLALSASEIDRYYPQDIQQYCRILQKNNKMMVIHITTLERNCNPAE